MTNTTSTYTGTTERWHVECLACGSRFNWGDVGRTVHNAGYDWEDATDYCIDCGEPLTMSSGPFANYAMHDGPAPRR
jgi:hypothetical protein